MIEQDLKILEEHFKNHRYQECVVYFSTLSEDIRNELINWLAVPREVKEIYESLFWFLYGGNFALENESVEQSTQEER